tara:strand:+ start:131 stop:724 length:594 start_codon:yes stop_codon:yes gene_type:complete
MVDHMYVLKTLEPKLAELFGPSDTYTKVQSWNSQKVRVQLTVPISEGSSFFYVPRASEVATQPRGLLGIVGNEDVRLIRFWDEGLATDFGVLTANDLSQEPVTKELYPIPSPSDVKDVEVRDVARVLQLYYAAFNSLQEVQRVFLGGDTPLDRMAEDLGRDIISLGSWIRGPRQDYVSRAARLSDGSVEGLAVPRLE